MDGELYGRNEDNSPKDRELMVGNWPKRWMKRELINSSKGR